MVLPTSVAQYAVKIIPNIPIDEHSCSNNMIDFVVALNRGRVEFCVNRGSLTIRLPQYSVPNAPTPFNDVSDMRRTMKDSIPILGHETVISIN